MTDLSLLDATTQAELVRTGAASPIELVDAAITRIEKCNDELNAVIHPLFDRARTAANGILPDGPFRGVPILIKDLDGTLAGAPYHGGNKLLKELNYTPEVTSYLFSKLEEAGFVIVGKTNTPEFGTVAFTESELNGSTLNPWNPELTPGGSSGGAAAALAAGLVPIAHGTDGGGSIRIPASCCGVFGLKPSRGRVSTAPFMSLEGLSTSGPLARSVADAAAFLDVVAGYEPGDPWWTPPPERPFAEEVSIEPGRLRVAITAEPPIEAPIHPDCRLALTAAASLLEDLGHDVVEATPPWTGAGLIDAFIAVWQVGPTLYPVDPELLTPFNRDLAAVARRASAADYARAVLELQTAARRIVAFWKDVDVVLTPTLALPPVPIGWQEEGVSGAIEQLYRNTVFTPFTAIANLTGQPAVSLPLHWNDEGLPIGVQAIGHPAGEAQLLRLAAQLERARPWRQKRPPIS